MRELAGVSRFVAIVAAMLLSVAFYLAIIGVLELRAAIGSLLVFVIAGLVIWTRN